MALTLNQEGPDTAPTNANESIVGAAITTVPKTMVFRFDLVQMAAADIMEVRVYTGVLAADTSSASLECHTVVTFSGVRGDGLAPGTVGATGAVLQDSPPIMIIGRGEVHVKRIAGAASIGFDYGFYFID